MECSKRSLLRLGASLTLIGVPLAVQGQERPAAPKEPENNSRYVGEQPEGSGFAVELHSASTWDDNILGNNALRIRDHVFDDGGLFSLWTNRPAWRLRLEYRPNALLYRTASNFNQVDQRLSFNNEFHLARHLLFRLKDSLDYATGVMEPQTNGDISLPIGAPSNLNATLFTPFARQLGNDASGGLEYDVSYRSSLSLSGDHGFRRFSNVSNSNVTFATNLFNTQSDSGGASYSYRMTRHFTAGLEYKFQDFRFSQAFQTRIHGGFLKVLWDVSPHVTLSAFGGPEYLDSQGQFVAPSTNPAQPGSVATAQRGMQWNLGGGGAVTFRSNQTVFRLSAQQMVGDGGGLLAGATNSYESAEIRRRMTGRLDVALTASNARTVALLGPTGKGKVDTQAGGVSIEYPLAPVLNLHLGYDYMRQRTNQFVPFAVDVDRNRVTLGLFYRTHDYAF